MTVLFSSFIKNLRTKSVNAMLLFGCPSVATVVNQRKVKLLSDYVKSCNSVCLQFAVCSQNELDALYSASSA